MSFSSDEDNAAGSQKRPRACDLCRRKKVRCNGPEQPGGRCTSCTIADYNCTYLEASTRRLPSKRYIASLERRAERLDTILQKLRPDGTLYEDWISALDEDGQDRSRSHLLQPPKLAMTASPIDRLIHAIRTINVDNPPSWDDENTELAGPTALIPETERFFGKSSVEMLAQAALKLKSQLEGKERGEKSPVLSKRRELFWTTRPWEIKPELPIPYRYTFPDLDLAPNLVDLYFENINLYFPVLHRPSFQRSIQEGLYYVDEGFATIYLLVCSIGARFSDDPRVLLEDSEEGNSGWQWFDQVQGTRTPFPSPPTLYTIQDYCLSALFVHTTSSHSSVWSFVGVGIRLAQDVGAHRRRKTADQLPTIEHELWKRAFWVLLIIDRISSASHGRPLAIFAEEYDLDLPIDCDDEYWEHPDPEKRFKQPPNQPSLVSAFCMHIKLMQLLTYCIRGLYSIKKSIVKLGLEGQEWKSPIVTELDSSLNKWFNSLPDHLKWDPDREDIRLVNLSGMLHAAYYNCRILIHLPFIRLPMQQSPLPFPSLTICINAARACTHVAYTQLKRNKLPLTFAVLTGTFTSAVVLIFNLWSGKRPGVALERNGDLANVEKCFQVLQVAEDRWQQSDSNVLRKLALIKDLDLDAQRPRPVGHFKGQLYQPMNFDEFDQLFFGRRRPPLFETSGPHNKNAESYARFSEDQHPNVPLSRLFLVPDMSEISREGSGLHRVDTPDSDGDSTASSTFSKVSEPCLDPANALNSFSTGGSFSIDTPTSCGVHEASSLGSITGHFGYQHQEPPRGEQSFPAGASQQQGSGTADATLMWSNVLAGFGSEDWAGFLASLNNSTYEQSSNFFR